MFRCQFTPETLDGVREVVERVVRKTKVEIGFRVFRMRG